MALRLADKWVWDFWLVRNRSEHHMFFLQAPRALRDPELRHNHASIGHAVSADLTEWELLPDALHPGSTGSWDDLATWTGSVIEHAGRWWMLYTGVGTADAGLVQRIGLASSKDLVHWEKYSGNPVLEADPRWYELLDLGRWRHQAWRDPWLFRSRGDGVFHALITARVPTGPSDGAGVVAHARSRDLVSWEVLPPITAPGEVAQAEVPQLVRFGDSYELLVSCLAEDHSRSRQRRLATASRSGTFAFSSRSPCGPFSSPVGPLLDARTPGVGYAGKLVALERDDFRFLCFVLDNGSGFGGEISDPFPVRRNELGELSVDASPLTAAGSREQGSTAN